MNIEELDLDIKVYNRLKKNLPDVQTVNHLIAEMYDQNGVEKVSAPDMKKIEEALKAKGIFKYMRGDEVDLDDIETEPLTWDELRQYVGGLVVSDDSTQSHRWLHLCWIYDMDDDRVSYLCRSNSYQTERRAAVEQDNTKRVEFAGEMLRHEGHFFALKKYAMRMDGLEVKDNEEDVWPHGETFYFSDNPEVFGKELTYDELKALPENTLVIVEDTACEEDDESDLSGELWRRAGAMFETTDGVRVECLDEEENIQYMKITRKSMEVHDRFWTRVFLKTCGGAHTDQKPPPAEQEPEQKAEIIQSDADPIETAKKLHKRIVDDAQSAAESLWDMCNAIKEMRDGKHYKALLYDNFEGYCEEALGMSRGHAYRYIQIAEGMTAENVSSMRQIGATKLALLASVTEEQRETVAASVDIESATVKQLKVQIDALKHQNDQTEAALKDAEGRAQKWCDIAEEKRQKIEEQNGRFVKDQQEIAKLNAEIYNNQDYICKINREKTEKDASIKQLQARIDELEMDTDLKDDSITQELAEKQDEIEKLMKRIEELESRPVEVAVKEDAEALDNLRKEYEEKLKAVNEDAQYREVLAMVSNARSVVNSLCIRLQSIPSGKARDSLVSKTKEISLLIGLL